MATSNEYMRVYMKQRYYRRRQEVVEKLGNKCKHCGGTEELEIDHIDPKKKSFSLGKALAGVAQKKLDEEIKKCQLLCTDCHIEKSKIDGSPMKGRKKLPRQHGTVRMYGDGCRCAPCKKAKSESRKGS